MSFLDEKVTLSKDDPKATERAADLAKQGVDSSIEEKKKKSTKRPDYADVDGDGNKTEPMAKAFKDKENVDELNVTGEYEGQPTRVTGDDFYNLLQAGLKASDSPEAFVNYVTFGITDETSQLSLEDQQKLKDWYMQNKQMEEGKLKNILTGAALFTALMAGNKAIVNSDKGLQDLKAKYEKAEEADDKEKMKELKDKITKYEIFLTTGKKDKSLPESLNEAVSPEEMHLLNGLLLWGSALVGAARIGLVPPNPIRIIKMLLQQRRFNQIYKRLKNDPEIIATAKQYPNGGREWINYINSKLTDEEKKNLNVIFHRGTLRDKLSGIEESTTLFEIDLKPLLEKHGKEGTVKITKAIMNKLHGKGEATVDGTKLVFKENHIEQDTQLALPEPPAKDFLGDDGKDYEGGMAKSQILQMKSYADRLCNMIDDESQLEAWVQAKLTKASDYMSAVYHYLDYQNQKDERPDQGTY